MKTNPTIFREYDIRGIAGRELSPEFAECLGLAYAQLVGQIQSRGLLKLSSYLKRQSQ
jgi:phosphomannomutase